MAAKALRQVTLNEVAQASRVRVLSLARLVTKDLSLIVAQQRGGFGK